MRRVMRITRLPYQSMEFAEKEEREQKGGHEYEIELQPRSARNTGRKTGREESIHTRHKLIETGKQTRNVHGDREAIIGKAPRLGIHTLYSNYASALLVALRGIFREHNFTKFADMPCGGCECVVEGGSMQGCCVGGRIGVWSLLCMEEVTVKQSRCCRVPIVGVMGRFFASHPSLFFLFICC